MIKKVILSTIIYFLLHTPAQADFYEDFDALNPSTPTTFYSLTDSVTSQVAKNWDITVHVRDGSSGDGWGNGQNYNLLDNVFNAQHALNCNGPDTPELHTMQNVHAIDEYEEVVFSCRKHLMTSIYSNSAAQAILTPNHLLQLPSTGEATIQFDASTMRRSNRHYWQINITPINTHLQLPRGTIVADIKGNIPQYGITIGQSITSTGGHLQVQQFDGAHNRLLNYHSSLSYDDFLPSYYDQADANADPTLDLTTGQSARRRDTFKITISDRQRLRVCMTDYPTEPCLVDLQLAEPFQSHEAVVQFGQHSYNDTKSCGDDTCKALTIHWDNFWLSPTRPFTITRPAGNVRSWPGATNAQVAAGADPIRIDFGPNYSAPPYTKFRFTILAEYGADTATIDDDVQVSFNEGASWVSAKPSPIDLNQEVDNFKNDYFTGGDLNGSGYVPEGANTVLVKGYPTYRFDAVWVMDAAMWTIPPEESGPPPPEDHLSYLDLIKQFATNAASIFDFNALIRNIIQ